ncbi:GntR family transcriptional regulator [Phyllobacterium salinisoli]|uniref:GntR family transcriptional regulator n=1 Tax=Phyllobacterium salinisoli TaxID=1899321 RepID=A0A368K7Y9_9HYPH|nr:GntR family transcriptional regulator [Phyllobacterium salinisoli]RCS25334.1 GntR family transcriptional regulator [Phyllobacterium salinisoli]
MHVRTATTFPVPPHVYLEKAVGPQLWHAIREWILRGELLPGARLSEVDLANVFGVSRQPVREAFIKLAEESLLEIRPQRGTYVSRIRIDAVTSARFVREAVEADIVRLVAAQPSDELIHDLERLLDEQRLVAEGPEPQGFLALDEQFHRRLAEAAGQGPGWEILQPLKTQMDRMRYLNARHFPRDRLITQHADVVSAIRERDPDAAEAAMRGHLRQILDDLPVMAAALPDFFEPRGGIAT